MSTRPVMIPNATHPITVEPFSGRVTVSAHGQQIADSRSVLLLKESTYPAVAYVPLKDVEPEVLRDSTQTSYCPFKGDATYLSVEVDGGLIADGIWRYEQPYAAVSDIAGHVAFYPDRFDIQLEADPAP